MNNDDPLHAYAQSMQQVTASDQLKQRVFANADSLQPRENPSMPKLTPHGRKPRAPQAIAACLVLALAIGGATAIASTSSLFTVPEDGNENTSTSINGNNLGGFSPFGETLQAYAATTNTLIPANENGELLFSRTLEASLPAKNQYEQYGYYTGCLLAIDTDNISSVSFSIDKGQLYQGSIDAFVNSDDPQRWTDALTWKYGEDQSANSYKDYDYVQPLANLDGKSKEDPTKECRVETAVLLGSNATLDADEATHSFVGIWTNEPYDGLANDPFNAAICTLDGAHLTVTYTYEDDTTAQTTYELKATCVEVDYSGSAISTTSREVSPDNANVSSAYTLKAIPVAK